MSVCLFHLAASLARRGMRQIKIRDTESGLVFDERGLRQHLLSGALGDNEKSD